MIGKVVKIAKQLLPNTVKRRGHLVTERLLKRMENSKSFWKLAGEYRLLVQKQLPIIIYQVGKVGSSSIYRTLKREGLFVFHQHHLGRDFLKETLAGLERNDSYYRYTGRALWIADRIIRPGRPVKIITLTRDPIARSVSGFFETLDRRSGIKQAHQHYSSNELQERFLTHLNRTTSWINWYDFEFKDVTRINVYDDYAFDPAVGYLRIQERNFDVLLLRLETPDEIKEQAIAEFLNLPGFKLTNANVGEDKAYSDVYQVFKQKVHIPTDILDRNYHSRHVRYFYSEDEIARFRARWEQTDKRNT